MVRETRHSYTDTSTNSFNFERQSPPSGAIPSPSRLRNAQALVKSRSTFKLQTCALGYLGPHLVESLNIVRKNWPPRPGPPFQVPHSLPKDHRTGGRRPEELDTVLQQLPLLLPAEQVQHHPEMEEVHLAHQPKQGAALAEIKGIRLDQRRLQGVLVPEEVVTELDESLLQLRAVQVRRRRAVLD